MILCIETSTATCSAAIGSRDQLLAFQRIDTPEGGHAACLAPMVDRLLSEVKSQGHQLTAVAVSAGPGSYTGLRIGASLAKGLCLGLYVPLVAVDTLELLANQARQLTLKPETLIYPMLDARRMEVYTACFDSEGKRLEEDHSLVLSAEDYPLSTEHPCLLVGDGAPKAAGLWSNQGYEIGSTISAPLADAMIPLAEDLLEAGKVVDIAYWTPNYLKDYIAVVAKNKVLGR